MSERMRASVRACVGERERVRVSVLDQAYIFA